MILLPQLPVSSLWFQGLLWPEAATGQAKASRKATKEQKEFDKLLGCSEEGGSE